MTVRSKARTTDYQGFLGNLDPEGARLERRAHGSAIVLGAGGAARAVLVALRERGVSRIHVLNRTIKKAEDLALELGGPLLAGHLSDFGVLRTRASSSTPPLSV